MAKEDKNNSSNGNLNSSKVDKTSSLLKEIENSKEDFKRFIILTYQRMFYELLNIVENFIIVSSINGEKIFSNIRAKILRIGNNAIREIEKKFEEYDVRPKFIYTEQIDFGNQNDSNNKFLLKEEIHYGKGNKKG